MRCLQKAGASSLEALVAVVGSTAPQIAASLVWEGPGDNGTQDPAVSRLRRNGEPLLDLQERILLAGFAQGLEKAWKAEVATQGPEEGQVAAGPGIQALAQAAGYGAWPQKFLPDRAMIVALDKGSKGENGVPIPYADAKAAPWFDTDEWAESDAKGDTAPQPPKHLFLQYGDSAEELGFGGVGADIMAREAYHAAARAAKMKIRAALWTAAIGRIMRGLAVYGSLGPDRCSVASNYLAVLAEMAAIHGHDFAIKHGIRLRHHIAKEALTAAQARPLLRAPDDDRVNAQLQKESRERDRQKAAAGKGGMGAGHVQPNHQRVDRRDNRRDDCHGNRRDHRRDDRRDDGRDDPPAAAAPPPELKLLGPPPKRQGGWPQGAAKRQRGGRQG